MRVTTTLLLAIVALGCSIEAPSAGPTSSPSPSPAPSARAAPASTPPTPQIKLVGSGPVVRPTDLGPDYLAVLPAAYFVVDGTRHAYMVAFGSANGEEQVFHATSSDGIEWSIDTHDPMADLGLEMSPPGPIPASILPSDDDAWQMFLWGYPGAQRQTSSIFRATAASPAGPWAAAPDAVLAPGAGGEFDAATVDFPAIVRDGTGYLMLYGANADLGVARIGAARSTNGGAWTKLGQVMEPVTCGGPESNFIAIPRLFTVDGGYLALVVMGPDVYLARSLDGVEWSCQPEPVFVAATIPGSDRVHTIAATRTEAGISVLIEALIGTSGGTDLWLGDLTGV